MEEITLLQKTKGLHSKIASIQGAYSPSTGFTYLEANVNTDITDSNRIKRRDGFTLLSSEAVHSLFTWQGISYCVRGNDLFSVNSDYSLHGIRSGVGNLKMRYCGTANAVFYSNGLANGYITGGVSFPWEPGEYVGPDTVVEYVAPPLCRHLTEHKGRLYLSVGNALLHTPPFSFYGVDKATGYISFPSKIRAVVSVDDCLLVATESEVYALLGNSPVEGFVHKVILRDKLIEDTTLTVINQLVNGKVLNGKTCIFTTSNGIFAVGSSGQLIELTEDRLALPVTCNSGNAYIKDNFYTVLIDA